MFNCCLRVIFCCCCLKKGHNEFCHNYLASNLFNPLRIWTLFQNTSSRLCFRFFTSTVTKLMYHNEATAYILILKEKSITKIRTSKATRLKVTPVKVTPVKVTPVKVTPVKVTPLKVTAVKVTPVKVTPVKVTPVKVTALHACSVAWIMVVYLWSSVGTAHYTHFLPESMTEHDVCIALIHRPLYVCIALIYRPLYVCIALIYRPLYVCIALIYRPLYVCIDPFHLNLCTCAMDWGLWFAGCRGERVSWVAGQAHKSTSSGENLAFHGNKVGRKDHCCITNGRIKARNSVESIAVLWLQQQGKISQLVWAREWSPICWEWSVFFVCVFLLFCCCCFYVAVLLFWGGLPFVFSPSYSSVLVVHLITTVYITLVGMRECVCVRESGE